MNSILDQRKTSNSPPKTIVPKGHRRLAIFSGSLSVLVDIYVSLVKSHILKYYPRFGF